jgi:hypothetical protein
MRIALLTTDYRQAFKQNKKLEPFFAVSPEISVTREAS